MNEKLAVVLLDVVGAVLAFLVQLWLGNILGAQAAERPSVQIDAHQVDIFLAPSPPAPVAPSTQMADFAIPDTGNVHARTCTDDQGRKGAFQAMIFLDSYNWVRGSMELVEFHSEVIPYFPTVLRQEPVQKILNGAQQIIAVGTASCESPFGFLVENYRAQKRAEQLVRWVEESRSQLPRGPDAPMRSVIALSLGHFTQGCTSLNAEETSGQRRIVLIAITEKQKDLDLKSCLRSRMEEEESLKFLTDNYSKFDLDTEWKVSP